MRVVLLALTSALAVVGCERGPVASESTRASAPALASASAAASGSGPSAAPAAAKEEPLIEVNLDGRSAEGSSDLAAEVDGPEGHGDDEPMDDVDDTSDISGAPVSVKGSEGDDPAVQADEKAVEKPLMKGP